MPISDPIGTIDTGEPGRPASVKRTAERLIGSLISVALESTGIVPCAVPKKTVRTVSREIAERVLADLIANDLHIVPGKIVRDLALLVGRDAVDKPSSTS